MLAPQAGDLFDGIQFNMCDYLASVLDGYFILVVFYGFPGPRFGEVGYDHVALLMKLGWEEPELAVLDFKSMFPFIYSAFSHDDNLVPTPDGFHDHRKALTVAQKYPKALVIGSDTVVALGSKTFAKPNDLQEAARFLKRLSGKIHQVISGVCLLQMDPLKVKLFSDTTHVGFQRLTDQTIREYLSLINPLDKAGGYAIQEHGEWIIGEIFGSYTNVVGLPMERLREELKLW